ncbi:MAG: hypothetical protein BGO69_15915 [Bacteroidetes bacterium 46-16]|nr:MAG: hypothetical protein BGO69_15915 [Bacteroidetes bacterium 46-16]
MQQYFINQSKDERVLLDNIINGIFNKAKYNIEYYFTAAESQDVYDAYVMLFDKETHSMRKSYVIEMKIRNTHYDDLMLEKIKYKDLKAVSVGTGASILYINTTPQGTYIFNLSELDYLENVDWNERKYNKKTLDKSYGKVNKLETKLDIKLAKTYPLKQSDLELLKANKEVKSLLKKTIEKQKRCFCLYRDVFGVA